MVYENLTEFERALARFGDKVDMIVGFEVSGKLSAEEAYQQIKDMMKDLKRLRKTQRRSHSRLDNDIWE
jgi:polyhydroxyalkanoate synthesis regulator phasin